MTLSNNNQTLTLSAGTIPAGVDNGSTVTPGICTITGSVTAPGNSAGGTMWNAIPTNTLTNDQDVSNTTSASDYIYVDPQSIDVYKYFSPTRFELGGQTRVTIRLTNPTSTDVTNVNLTDILPSGLTPTAIPDVQTTCGGVVTVSPTSITLTNGTIGADSFCTFSALVTTMEGATATSYRNEIPENAITGAGITNNSSTYQDVYVYPVGLGATVSKTFEDSNAAQRLAPPSGYSSR